MAITIIPMVSAQLVIGNEANQKLIEVKLDKSEIIHVKHVISSSNSPVSLTLFKGEISNLTITNEEGKKTLENNDNVGIMNDGLGNESILIFPTKQDSIIEYNLEDASILNDNMLTVRIQYSETFSILFSDDIEVIFINDNIINIGESKGLSINEGGKMVLQYYSNIPKTIEKIQWEENYFDVEISSDIEINEFNFEQESKSITFQINEKNKFVTISMSEELLGGPYLILLNDEKIEYSKYISKENQVSLSMKPESQGQITIIGTTVIPEFSMFIPLIMGFLVVLTVPFMKKINLH
jgi:predicted DNA binding CopG/RHH family protein